MLEPILIKNVWAAEIIAVLIYVADYFLSVYELKLYHGEAKKYLAFEGRYNSTTIFRFKKDQPQAWNPRFLWVLLVLVAAIGVAWYLLVLKYNLPEVFAFMLGGLILMEMTSMIRQLRFVILFNYLKKGKGLRGKAEVSRRLSAILWFNELYGFGILFFFCFLLTGSWFFLGGGFTCLVTARRQRDWAVMLPEPFFQRPLEPEEEL